MKKAFNKKESLKRRATRLLMKEFRHAWDAHSPKLTRLAKMADATAHDRGGWTILRRAAIWGNSAVVDIMLAKGADIEKSPRNAGGTPLVVAVDRGHVKVVKSLLAVGANISAQDEDGLTALEIAQKNVTKTPHGAEILAMVTESALENLDRLAQKGAPRRMKTPPVPALPKKPFPFG